MVRGIRMEMPRIGTRKLYHMLYPSLKEKKVGRDRLFDILRANHLLIKPPRSFHVTTNSRHKFHKHRNLIVNIKADTSGRNPGVGHYLHRQQGVSYVPVIGHRRLFQEDHGICLSGSLDTQGCLNALAMANRNRLYREEPLIHHSDRGIQYCSGAYQRLPGL